MSYTKQTWTTGETITATKLNHMEDGIEGAAAEYDFTTSITPSLDSRGVYSLVFNITPTSSSSLTVSNATKIRAYLLSSSVVYPVIVTYSAAFSTYFTIYIKSIYGNPQGTSSTTISGTLHVVAPFSIANVTQSM